MFQRSKRSFVFFNSCHFTPAFNNHTEKHPITEETSYQLLQPQKLELESLAATRLFQSGLGLSLFPLAVAPPRLCIKPTADRSHHLSVWTKSLGNTGNRLLVTG